MCKEKSHYGGLYASEIHGATVVFMPAGYIRSGRVDDGNLETDSGQQDFFAVSVRSRSASQSVFGQIRDLVNTLTSDQVSSSQQLLS